MMRAKQAHDPLISEVYRAQADALQVEALAKMRLADEIDAAQERGEVADGRDGPGAGVTNGNAKATAADLVGDDDEVKPTAQDLGLHREDIRQARKARDAEAADPGITERALKGPAGGTLGASTRAWVRRKSRCDPTL